MSLTPFSSKVSHHKNGIWWFTKVLARAVGEERWDSMRLLRRVYANKVYYARQQLLFDCFYEWPQLAQLIGIYPKLDTSHGLMHFQTYEMYRDWQENSLNSDGSFALWIYLIAAIYSFHLCYSYMLPYYWTNLFPVKNEEMVRLRMKDAIATTVHEELILNQASELGWAPHDFHYNKIRGMQGYTHPDDPRTLHCASFNRKHRYREHYTKLVGDQHHMTYPR